MRPHHETVRASIDIPAPVDTVWRAFADPSWVAGWLAERVEGELGPGRRPRLFWDSLGLELDVEVIDWDPPRRLSWAGARPGADPQLQTVELVPGQGGGTRVTLVHAGFAAGTRGQDQRAGSAAGWHTALRVLAHYLAAHPGRSRACRSVLAPVATPLAAVDRLLHQPDGLARWLAAHPPRVGGEGTAFELSLAGDARVPVSGLVLAAAPPYQLAFEWSEVAGVLGLRAVRLDPDGDGAVLAGVQAWSWEPERPAWQAAHAALEAAVERLATAAATTPLATA